MRISALLPILWAVTANKIIIPGYTFYISFLVMLSFKIAKIIFSVLKFLNKDMLMHLMKWVLAYKSFC